MEKKSHIFYLWQLYCWFCLLVICVSYSSIVVKFLYGAHPQHHAWCSQQTKETNRNKIYSECLSYPYVAMICAE